MQYLNFDTARESRDEKRGRMSYRASLFSTYLYVEKNAAAGVSKCLILMRDRF
jgi:hypothetical protein